MQAVCTRRAHALALTRAATSTTAMETSRTGAIGHKAQCATVRVRARAVDTRWRESACVEQYTAGEQPRAAEQQRYSTKARSDGFGLAKAQNPAYRLRLSRGELLLCLCTQQLRITSAAMGEVRRCTVGSGSQVLVRHGGDCEPFWCRCAGGSMGSPMAPRALHNAARTHNN